MTWVRVEPDAPYHQKLQRVGVEGFGLFVAGLCYANRCLTDGLIHQHALPAVFPGAPRRRLESLAGQLVAAGLWEVVEGGWRVHDFHQYQPTKAEALDQMRRASERYAAGGRSRASMAQRIQGRFTSVPASDNASVQTSDSTSDAPASTSTDPIRTDPIREPPLAPPVASPPRRRRGQTTSNGHDPRAVLAWGEIMRWVRSGSTILPSDLDPRVRSVLQRMGGWSRVTCLRNSDAVKPADLTTTRLEFLQVYSALEASA